MVAMKWSRWQPITRTALLQGVAGAARPPTPHPPVPCGYFAQEWRPGRVGNTQRMLYAVCMITADTDLGDFDDEGDAMHVEHHVSIHEGRVWLSPMALDDIEYFTGHMLST